MHHVHVARQPIFRGKSALYGYELLFRDGTSNAFPNIDGDTATSRLLHHSFFTFDFEQLSAGAYAFVNFTQELLVRRVPMMFPPERLVVEVVEDVTPTDAVRDACKDLVQAGYRLVLDDFTPGRGLEPLVELASMIKLDLRVTPPTAIARIIADIGRKDLAYVAEKVETHDELAAAAEAGCTHFQGYFFARPEVLSVRDVRAQTTTLLQLLHAVNRPDIEVDELERLVSQDVSITYKLLRYINSAFFKRPRRVESVRQAIIYLGEREIRQFVSLVATAKLSADKPEELVRTAIVRARACDALGRALPGRDGAELFLVGLLSCIDAITDRPMAEVVAQLPLSPSLERALVHHDGWLADALALVLAYERGAWADFSRLCDKLGLDADAFVPVHLEALAWAQTFMQLPD